MTGIEPNSIALNNKETLNMICSADTLGIPEFEGKFVRSIILETKPTDFEDLIKISGLSHGTDVWENNAQDLIKNGTATLKEVIGCRDDIMNYLISLGMEKHMAYLIMEYVRKGKAKNNQNEIWDDYKSVMKKYNVPDWYIKSCEKIKYMFPKSHAVGYVINNFRIAWYKLHYPQEFNETISEFADDTE